jgi:hypothetical protein
VVVLLSACQRWISFGTSSKQQAASAVAAALESMISFGAGSQKSPQLPLMLIVHDYVPVRVQ